MLTATVEDYLKAIYALQRDSPTGEASVVRIATLLGVAKGTVTSMVRKLCEAGLTVAEPYSGVRLTPKGKKAALDVVRRHRLVEVFLVEVLGFDWSEVHEEAERLEHAMSAKLLNRLDAYLGHPSIDPHGAPIPDAQGKMIDDDSIPLGNLATGDQAMVNRVDGRDSAFLQFAATHGLTPGAVIDVIEVSREADSIQLKAKGRKAVSLSFHASQRIHVTKKNKS